VIKINTILEIKEICKNFAGLKALTNINIKIERREIRGIIGPNGSGKTTLFNIMSGIYLPNGGEIYLNKGNIIGLRPDVINKRGIARTFQNIKIFPKMTILENIMVAVGSKQPISFFSTILQTKKANKWENEIIQESETILTSLKLWDHRNSLAGSLPYGKQRILEIARAWSTNPTILLLDEPGAGMNRQEKRELISVINELNKKGITIVLVEHDMKLVMELTQQISVLDSGELIAEGTPREISNNQKVIEAYLGKEKTA
jgi:branched-chain amino acid transport system ATP-binding protein